LDISDGTPYDSARSTHTRHQLKAPQPAVIGAVQAISVKEHGVSLNGTSRVALVVEDEWLVRDVITAALRSAGWEVLETGTGEDAIALMRAGHCIDLVFTDIQLAGVLGGWDVAEQCRAVQSDLPIIYASGNSVDRSRRVAGSLFFNKPYRPEDVVEACHRLC
jgi:CheY-like chemotaxis protein